jgi:hypothetical protein
MTSPLCIGVVGLLALFLPQESGRMNDPTVRDPRLERALETPASPVAEPAANATKPANAITPVELRGLVVLAGEPAGGKPRASAVLSIDGHFVRVESGTEFAHVRVLEVSAEGVRIEYTTLGTTALLR